MSYLIDLLKSPSGFSKDPWRFFWNQVGHTTVIGYGLTFLGMPVWLLFLGYVLWEFTQWKFYKAQLWDCCEDITHVMLGSLTAHYQLIALAGLQLILLASGFLRRYEEARND